MKTITLLTALATSSFIGTTSVYPEDTNSTQADAPAREDQVQKKEIVDPWASAEAAFAKHIAPLVKRLRSKCDDPRAQYAEFRSTLLKKYLPDHRVYVQDCMIRLISTPEVFLLDRKGNIVDLGEVSGTWDEKVKVFRVQGITDVLKSQGVKIEDADGAIEVAKLIKELQSASSDVSGLRRHSKNYTVFDRTYIPHLGAIDYALPNWAYFATEKNGGWTVNIRFVGPPEVSIIMPPSYEIDVDEKQVFSDIRIRQ